MSEWCFSSKLPYTQYKPRNRGGDHVERLLLLLLLFRRILLFKQCSLIPNDAAQRYIYIGCIGYIAQHQRRARV